ncbi:MAG TPA: DUF2071 domain-containing protein [Opitutaceae bacterium]|nr:DUF2071 domain-containing protein [Opitutaceae bacterium]
MRWTHLLFLHWQWDPAEVQRTLPPGLTVDTFEGNAWIGLVPFFMRDVRPAFFPAVPVLSHFLEFNVRTYVYDAHGRPGVWFYSLDCNRWLAVKTARALFHLKYEHAEMNAQVDAAGAVDYHVCRRGEKRRSRFVYRLDGPTGQAPLGSQEFFLVERYRLFAHDARRDRLLSGAGLARAVSDWFRAGARVGRSGVAARWFRFRRPRSRSHLRGGTGERAGVLSRGRLTAGAGLSRDGCGRDIRSRRRAAPTVPLSSGWDQNHFFFFRNSTMSSVVPNVAPMAQA